jgi:mannose-1-phosphate guanylyltransferase / mannose-6-phosphate isomerase
MLVPLILSGGSGTRLWPLSRRLHPKQLLPLTGASTMLQQTVLRIDGLAELAAPIVVCNVDHATLVEAQLRQIERPAQAIVLEPVGRNTAPAVALAALRLLEGPAEELAEADDPLLLVLPADHVVLDPAAFRAAVELGRPHAEAGKLVTFGIVPASPHTGYGYIRAASPGEPSEVRQFVEKPDRATAERWLAEGGYYWNSGMFLLSARTYLEELRAHRPAMVEACARALAGRREEGLRTPKASEHAAAATESVLVHVDAAAFAACPSDSIDYAVMEKTTRAVVVPMDAGWNDVGSWAAVHEVSDHDAAGNSTVGDVMALDCTGSHLHAQHRLLAAVGVSDLVVVETEDAVLVAHRDRSQDVKKIVERLEAQGRPEASGHRTQALAWGSQRRLDASPPVSLWALTVDAGRHTPIESHAAWDRRLVVVSGEGELRLAEGEARPLRPGDSELLPARTGYALAATGEAALELLAVDLPA